MQRILQRGATAAVTAVAALGALAASADAKTVRGTVVHHNSGAHSFVVANRAGQMYAIHATHAPRIGSQVVVVVRKLHDGTFLQSRAHIVARAARRIRIRGVVSWADPRSGSFAISTTGASVLISRGRTAHATSGSQTTPSVGSDVVATATIDGQGDLQDQSVQTVGQNTGPISLEGTVLSVDPTAQTITVSADDDGQSGASIVVSVPATFDLPQFNVGEEVELLVQATGPGTATLVGSADDGSAQSANNQSDCQGQNPGSGDGSHQNDSSSDGAADAQQSDNGGGSEGGSATGSDSQSGSDSQAGSDNQTQSGTDSGSSDGGSSSGSDTQTQDGTSGGDNGTSGTPVTSSSGGEN
jgi:hypothetical protein